MKSNKYVDVWKIFIKDKQTNYWFVYKRYFSEWYCNEKGKCVRDKLDFFDTYFETREEAQRRCDSFNLNRN